MSISESPFKTDHNGQVKGETPEAMHPVGVDPRQDADAATQTRDGSLLTAARRTVEMIAGGASLADILVNLCTAIDAQGADIISTVMLMDPDGQRLWPTAGPRMPNAFMQRE